MKELQTIKGTNIPQSTRGILYLCIFDQKAMKFTVARELLFDCAFECLQHYANIPNPESQMMSGKTYDDLIKEVHTLHENIKDPEWLKELAECI